MSPRLRRLPLARHLVALAAASLAARGAVALPLAGTAAAKQRSARRSLDAAGVGSAEHLQLSRDDLALGAAGAVSSKHGPALGAAGAGSAERVQLWRDGLAFEDDGSQVSVPGAPLTLEDAVHQLFSPDAKVALSRGGAATSGVLASLALVYVSGRDDFDEALREAILQFVPHGGIFKTDGKTPANFVQAMEYAFEAFPNASWYYIADDDSFVHLERLAQYVSGLDPSQKLYVGRADCGGLQCGKQDVACQRQRMQGESNPGWACGGPGVLVSRPLAELMVRRRCSEYYGQTPPPVGWGDMVMACCAYDVWEGFNVLLAPGFQPYSIPEQLPSNEALIAIHKIAPEVTRELGRLYNSHLKSSP